MLKSASALAFALAIGLSVSPAPALAQAAGGKASTMIIGFGPGGGYDLWARTIARFIGKHIPGEPTVVSQNMPGAGSYVAASYMYAVAPKDGTVFGLIARDAVLGPLTGAAGARFDSTKFTWLGTPTTETNVCISMAGSKVKTIKDLYTTELIVGDTGPGTGTRSYPLALNALLGMKFKLVSGFPASSDVFLAMERGEVEGFCESLDSVIGKRPDWISSGKVNVLFQGGAEPNPDLKGVPYILDQAKNDQQKVEIRFLYAGQGIGRPFLAPPGMAPDKAKMLRDAFDATMADPEFVAEAHKLNLEVAPKTGAYLSALINEIYTTPKEVADKIGKLIQ